MKITGIQDCSKSQLKHKFVFIPTSRPNIHYKSRRTCRHLPASAKGRNEQKGLATRRKTSDCGFGRDQEVFSQRNSRLKDLYFLSALALCGGDGGGSNVPGWGPGGGGGGDSGTNPLYELAAADDKSEEEEDDEGEDDQEDDSDEETTSSDEEVAAGDDEDLAADEFKVDDVHIEGLPESGEGVPSEDELLAACSTQPGFVCNQTDIDNDKGMFAQSGIYQDVKARTEYKNGKTSVIFTLTGVEGPPPRTLDISAHKATSDLVLPASEIAKARRLILSDGEGFGARKMYQLKSVIEEWYRKQGFSYCYVTSVEGIETGNLKVKVLEGRVGNFKVTPIDAEGKPTEKPGHVPQHVILREIPFQRGEIYHQDMPQKCLRDVFGLGLFETMSVGCQQSHKDESKFDIDLQIKERPAKTCELDMEWAIAPTASGKPGLASIIPGGSLVWENSDLGGKNRTLSLSATTSNFLEPSDDLGYQLTYRQPDFKGPRDPKRTELTASIFNTRNLSAVFTGRGRDEHQPIMVDRTGAKVVLSERYSRNSTGVYGLVAEQVANLDEQLMLVSRAARTLPTGALDAGGPPTSLSPSGKDRLAFLLGNFTRDTTYFINGTQLGDRQIYQIEQGLGIGDTKPIFNRQRVSLTRFQQLGKQEPGSKAIPKTVVVHAGIGACMGDQPPYELFTLGGPLSVRGYNVGEVAASRAFAEGAIEVRVPVKGRRLYAYAEGASDLNSSKQVLGNPTAYFNKAGSAVSLGAGIKLGAARIEAATEGLARPTVLNVRFGERF